MTASYDVAHFREQGVDLIVIPVDSKFGYLTNEEQHAFIRSIQISANSAGLNGTVVPMWQDSSGRTSFISPPNWHPFFKTFGMQQLAANINKKLTVY